MFHYDFLTFDDQIYVTENPHVQSGLNFKSVAWAFQTSTSGNWIPLTWISHMLDIEWFGMKAGGHHLVNVLFHAANAVLLLLLLQKMTGAVWRSALVAAFFAWHPAHVESVAWIAERKDVLSTFFGLLSLLAWVRYAQGSGGPSERRGIFYLSAIVLLTFGLMAKPMLVTLPFVMLLLDFWPFGRMSRAAWPRLLLEKTPFFAVSAAACGVAVWAQQRSHAVAGIGALTPWHRLSHVLASYLDYVAMLFFPHVLAIFYPYPLEEKTVRVIAGAGLLMLVSVLALAGARRRPWLAVGWFWFIGTLVPVIGLVQVGDQSMADRYTYLPAIGLFIIVVWGGAELAARFPVVKWLAPAAGVALLAATWVQVHYWKDTRTVFEHALAVTEKNYVASALVGSLRAADGDLEGAMSLYRESVRDKPAYPNGHFFLAHGLELQGKIAEAKSEYAEALRLDPELEPAHIFLGLLLAREKQYDQAEAEYETVLKINPASAIAHNDLARLLQTEGRLDESAPHYLAALKYDPTLAQAHNNLGVLYTQKGQLADAVSQLREALRLNPGNMETEYNLALALNQQHQWPEASEILQRAAAARPKDANTQYQYGVALAGMGKTREAMGQYAIAILLTPDFPEALNELAWIAATDPRPELRNGTQALAMAEHACELTVWQQPAMLLTLAAAYAETGKFSEAMATVEKAKDSAKAKGKKELEEKAWVMRDAFEKRQTFRAN